MVGKPYLGITSCLPVLRPGQQMARRSWWQLTERLAGLGKKFWKAPEHLLSLRLALNEFVIYTALV
jgi:hypothetical protein